jgi:hypothetical protein
MRHLINRPIGAGLENDPDDIRIVRGTLKALKGDEIVPEKLSGFIDDDLDADIRNFQQRSGLTEDGRLEPTGETERNLISRITGEGMDRAAAGDTVLSRSVGDGGENDAADVVAMKRALGTLGYLKYDRTAPPPPFIDAKTVAALTDLQRDAKLLTDGRADPNGKTIAAIGELLEEKSDSEAPDETQVALGPGLIPLSMFFARAAPHVIRQVPPIVALNEATKKLTENERSRGNAQDGESDFTAHPSGGTKLEHIPPNPGEFGGGKTEFPPEDPDKNDGKHEGRPTDPIRSDSTVFPLPENPENLIQVFPGNVEKPELPIIIERRGSEPVRAFNERIKRAFETLGNELSIKIIHIGGSRDADGNEIPEIHFKNKETGGLKGGSFPDISLEFRASKRTIRIHINTMDILVDGVTPSAREQRAAERLSINMEDYATLIEIQKPGANETVDFDALIERYKEPLQNMIDFAEGKIDRAAFIRRIQSTEKLPTK